MKILIIDPEYYNMERPIRFLKKEHEVLIASGTKPVQNYHEAYNLNSFDAIFLEPCMPCGIFSLEETLDGLETGWPLYEKFMRDLKKTKVIIWTYPIEDYKYPTKEHPNRAWGENVSFSRKDGSDDYSMINVINDLFKK